MTNSDQELIYISYADEDRKIARQVSEYIEMAGFQVGRRDSIITTEERGEISNMSPEEAWKMADRMVLLLSKHSMPSNQKVIKEWFAFEEARKPIHPIYISKCKPHRRVRDYQSIDATDNLLAGLKQLLSYLQRPFESIEKIHARDRVVITTDAQETSLTEAMQKILEVMRQDKGSIELTPNQIRQVIQRSPSDWEAYNVSRVAEWSQAHYQLDNRFVNLTLLLDRGQGSESIRWMTSLDLRKFNNLQEVMDNAKDPVLVLLGNPGSGKSTLLRRLQLDYAIEYLQGKTPKITFFIQLNQYRPDSLGKFPEPFEWLSRRWRERYPDLPPMRHLVEQRQLILLLDAINEIPHHSPDDYHDSIRLWRQFVQETIRDYPGNMVIFSCRTLDYSAPLSSPALPVPHARIEPMPDEKIKEFLFVYIPTKADSIWQELKGSPQLSLFRTPYFLRLLVDQIEDNKKMPQGQAGLFTGFVRQALKREITRGNYLLGPNELLTERDHLRIIQDQWRGPYDLPSRGLLLRKLSELAYYMQEANLEGQAAQIRVAYEEACEVLAHKQAEDILKIGVALNILDEDTVRDEILFFHQLLQEFFAARQLAEYPNAELVSVKWRKTDAEPNLEIVLQQIADSDPLPPLNTTGWEETMTMASAMTKSPTTFIQKLLTTNLPLAANCAASPEVGISPALYDNIRHLLIKRTQDPQADLRARIEAGLALGNLSDPRFERRSGALGDYLMPPLVSIPEGSYPIGSDEGFYQTEEPLHHISSPAFQIGKFPVTNAEFACFIRSGGYEDERWWDTEAALAWLRNEGTKELAKKEWEIKRRILKKKPDLPLILLREGRYNLEQAVSMVKVTRMSDKEFNKLLDEWYSVGQAKEPLFWHDDLFNNPAKPVVGICWYEAWAYCNWLSSQTGLPFRLPTEKEWEISAAGLDGRRFSYGNKFDVQLGNTLETHVRRITPIGVFPGNETPEGCVDISGNIFEWTSSIFQPYLSDETYVRKGISTERISRVCRGGSWRHTQIRARSSYRGRGSPITRNDDLGFRVSLPLEKPAKPTGLPITKI